MKNKKVINILNISFVIFATFSALITLLIEPSNGIIKVNALPFGIKNWNLFQSIIIASNVLGILLVAYFITYKNEVIKYITVESTPETVNQSINNIAEEADQFNLAQQEKFKEDIWSLKEKETDALRRSEKILSLLCTKYEFAQAVTYLKEENILRLNVHYAFVITENTHDTIHVGEGIAGQVAKTGQFVYLKEVPAGYMKVLSGLGELSPSNLIIVPLFVNEQTVAIAELASFKEYSDKEIEEIVTSTKVVLEAILS